MFTPPKPCTSSSKAGKAKNKNVLAESHTTDALGIFGLVKILDKINPSILVSENIVEAKNTATYILLKAYLSEIGYTVHEKILNEEQSGSFERRTRYWFVAMSNGLEGFDINKIATYERQYETLGEILEGDHKWSDNQYLKDKAIRDKAAGKGFAKRHLVNAESTFVNTIGRFYQKRRSTEAMLVNDQGKESLLTVNETARVKSCPLSLIKGVVAATAYEGLGQGIDYNQGRGIGNLIGRYLRGLVEGIVAPVEMIVPIIKKSQAIMPKSVQLDPPATQEGQLVLSL